MFNPIASSLLQQSSLIPAQPVYPPAVPSLVPDEEVELALQQYLESAAVSPIPAQPVYPPAIPFLVPPDEEIISQINEEVELALQQYLKSAAVSPKILAHFLGGLMLAEASLNQEPLEGISTKIIAAYFLKILPMQDSLSELRKGLIQVIETELFSTHLIDQFKGGWEAQPDLFATWMIQRLSAMKSNERLLIPGGWVGINGAGHSVLYELHRSQDGSFSLCIYNAGGGAKFHPLLETIQNPKVLPLKCSGISLQQLTTPALWHSYYELCMHAHPNQNAPYTAEQSYNWFGSIAPGLLTKAIQQSLSTQLSESPLPRQRLQHINNCSFAAIWFYAKQFPAFRSLKDTLRLQPLREFVQALKKSIIPESQREASLILTQDCCRTAQQILLKINRKRFKSCDRELFQKDLSFVIDSAQWVEKELSFCYEAREKERRLPKTLDSLESERKSSAAIFVPLLNIEKESDDKAILDLDRSPSLEPSPSISQKVFLSVDSASSGIVNHLSRVHTLTSLGYSSDLEVEKTRLVYSYLRGLPSFSLIASHFENSNDLEKDKIRHLITSIAIQVIETFSSYNSLQLMPDSSFFLMEKLLALLLIVHQENDPILKNNFAYLSLLFPKYMSESDVERFEEFDIPALKSAYQLQVISSPIDDADSTEVSQWLHNYIKKSEEAEKKAESSNIIWKSLFTNPENTVIERLFQSSYLTEPDENGDNELCILNKWLKQRPLQFPIWAQNECERLSKLYTSDQLPKGYHSIRRLLVLMLGLVHTPVIPDKPLQSSEGSLSVFWSGKSHAVALEKQASDQTYLYLRLISQWLGSYKLNAEENLLLQKLFSNTEESIFLEKSPKLYAESSFFNLHKLGQNPVVTIIEFFTKNPELLSNRAYQTIIQVALLSANSLKKQLYASPETASILSHFLRKNYKVEKEQNLSTALFILRLSHQVEEICLYTFERSAEKFTKQQQEQFAKESQFLPVIKELQELLEEEEKRKASSAASVSPLRQSLISREVLAFYGRHTELSTKSFPLILKSLLLWGQYGLPADERLPMLEDQLFRGCYKLYAILQRTPLDEAFATMMQAIIPHRLQWSLNGNRLVGDSSSFEASLNILTCKYFEKNVRKGMGPPTLNESQKSLSYLFPWLEQVSHYEEREGLPGQMLSWISLSKQEIKQMKDSGHQPDNQMMKILQFSNGFGDTYYLRTPDFNFTAKDGSQLHISEVSEGMQDYISTKAWKRPAPGSFCEEFRLFNPMKLPTLKERAANYHGWSSKENILFYECTDGGFQPEAQRKPIPGFRYDFSTSQFQELDSNNPNVVIAVSAFMDQDHYKILKQLDPNAQVWLRPHVGISVDKHAAIRLDLPSYSISLNIQKGKAYGTGDHTGWVLSPRQYVDALAHIESGCLVLEHPETGEFRVLVLIQPLLQSQELSLFLGKTSALVEELMKPCFSRGYAQYRARNLNESLTPERPDFFTRDQLYLLFLLIQHRNLRWIQKANQLLPFLKTQITPLKPDETALFQIICNHIPGSTTLPILIRTILIFKERMALTTPKKDQNNRLDEQAVELFTKYLGNLRAIPFSIRLTKEEEGHDLFNELTKNRKKVPEILQWMTPASLPSGLLLDDEALQKLYMCDQLEYPIEKSITFLADDRFSANWLFSSKTIGTVAQQHIQWNHHRYSQDPSSAAAAEFLWRVSQLSPEQRLGLPKGDALFEAIREATSETDWLQPVIRYKQFPEMEFKSRGEFFTVDHSILPKEELPYSSITERLKKEARYRSVHDPVIISKEELHGPKGFFRLEKESDIKLEKEKLQLYNQLVTEIEPEYSLFTKTIGKIQSTIEQYGKSRSQQQQARLLNAKQLQEWLAKEILSHRKKLQNQCQELEKLANKGAPSKIIQKVFQLQLESQSGLRSYLKSKEHLRPLFLHGDLNRYKEWNPYLNDLEILELYVATEAWLVSLTQQQQRRRALRLLKQITQKDPIRKLSSVEQNELELRLYQELSAPLAYDPRERPKILVDESISNVRWRREQVEYIEKRLATSANHLQELVMGSGKSDFLIPMLAMELADGKNLAIVMQPESQIEEIGQKCALRCGEIGGNISLRLNWKCKSLQELNQLEQQLQTMRLKKQILLVTVQEIHSFLLNFFRASKLQVQNYLPILNFLRNHGIVIADESHLLFCRRIEYHGAVGQSKKVPEAFLSVVALLYTAIIHHKKLQFISLDCAPVRRLEESVAYDPKQHQDLIIKTIIDFLFQYPRFRTLISMSEKELRALGPTLSKYLLTPLNQVQELPKELEAAKKDLLAVVRYQLHVILPTMLLKKHGVHYGRFPDLSRAGAYHPLAGPWGGVDNPRRNSVFSSYHEQIAATLQDYSREGIREQDIAPLLNQLVCDFRFEQYGFVPQDLPSYSSEKRYINLLDEEFAKAMPLSKLQPSQYQELAKKLSASHLQKTYVSRQVLPHITTYPQFFRSTAPLLLSLFPRVMGMSATLGMDAPTLRPHFEVVLDEAILGKTLYHVLTRSPEPILLKNLTSQSLSKKFPTLTPPQLAAASQLEHLIVKNKKSLALMDGGALFKDLPGKKLATVILYLRPDLQAVVFLENDKKLILTRGSSEPAPYIFQSSEDLNRRFTYYDQLHCTGINITQAIDAIGIVTVTTDTHLPQFVQSIGRMRGFDRAQVIQLAVSSELVQTLNSNGIKEITNQVICSYTTLRQVREQLIDTPASVYQKLEALLFVHLQKAFRNPDFVKTEFLSLFLHQALDSPYLAYGIGSVEESSAKVLGAYADTLIEKLQKWMKTLPSNLRDPKLLAEQSLHPEGIESLRREMQILIEKMAKEGALPAKLAAKSYSAEGIEMLIEKEQEQELEKEQEQELQREVDSSKIKWDQVAWWRYKCAESELTEQLTKLSFYSPPAFVLSNMYDVMKDVARQDQFSQKKGQPSSIWKAFNLVLASQNLPFYSAEVALTLSEGKHMPLFALNLLFSMNFVNRGLDMNFVNRGLGLNESEQKEVLERVYPDWIKPIIGASAGVSYYDDSSGPLRGLQGHPFGGILLVQPTSKEEMVRVILLTLNEIDFFYEFANQPVKPAGGDCNIALISPYLQEFGNPTIAKVYGEIAWNELLSKEDQPISSFEQYLVQAKFCIGETRTYTAKEFRYLQYWLGECDAWLEKNLGSSNLEQIFIKRFLPTAGSHLYKGSALESIIHNLKKGKKAGKRSSAP